MVGNVASTGLPPEVSRLKAERLILGRDQGAGYGGLTSLDGAEEGQR